MRAETAQLRAAQAAMHNPGHSGAGNTGHTSAGNSGSSRGGGSGGGSSVSNGSGGGGNSGDGSNGGSNGAGGGSATAILQTSSTQLIVTVDLDASKQSEAKVGERVTVEMPNGTTVNGTITAVSPVAQSSSGSGSGDGGNGDNGSGNGGNGSGNGGNGSGGSSGTTIPVTIDLGRHVSGAGLDQTAVSVNFVQAKANNVLSVPVTALLAVSGGGYAVQQAAAPHRLIPVTVGLFAAGYVEISGPGVYSGLEVTDSQG